MQIFSKLQRNSTYYAFIVILIVFINLFSSSFLLFPLFLGYFLFCEEFFIGVIFLTFFTLFHNYNIFVFYFFYLFYKVYLIKIINKVFDKEYVEVANLGVIYIFLYFYLTTFIPINSAFIFALYNFSFDLIFIRMSKCKSELFYF